eukprot:CAMPEP_0181447724 /NCGR_PEP_ID=MMETSP1110-20121109/26769_1 /TAXON_ID=174948 /ORGANISM="Symbiodinium sp., Strain CCMP421" /LENGTH=160 /DNA_ID=CAMNT_0023571845 /DNA_START=21 /DNA_END=503 /DNA_ORIENTATION=-
MTARLNARCSSRAGKHHRKGSIVRFNDLVSLQILFLAAHIGHYPGDEIIFEAQGTSDPPCAQAVLHVKLRVVEVAGEPRTIRPIFDLALFHRQVEMRTLCIHGVVLAVDFCHDDRPVAAINDDSVTFGWWFFDLRTDSMKGSAGAACSAAEASKVKGLCH